MGAAVFEQGGVRVADPLRFDGKDGQVVDATGIAAALAVEAIGVDGLQALCALIDTLVEFA
jgi:hypothetical protein